MGEIDVPGSIDEVEQIRQAVFCLVAQRHRVALDSDATLTLDVHGIQDLIAELAVHHTATPLNETVREGRFAVVYVSNDAEIANLFQM